jgi:hypothetical protein
MVDVAPAWHPARRDVVRVRPGDAETRLLLDRRRHGRTQMRVPVALESWQSERVAIGYMKNLSRDGAFVDVFAARPLGRSLALRFRQPGCSRDHVVDVGVCWRGLRGIGVEFLACDAAARDALLALAASCEPEACSLDT